jgi:hypothetical protein
VHALPSSHAVASVLAGFEQLPVPGSHTPAEWHWSEAVHTTGLAPTHVPAWHVSVCVHRFPSLHAVPFAFAGFEHAPVVELQTPSSWH